MDDNKLSKIILQYKRKRYRYTEKPFKKTASKLSRLHSIPCRKKENKYKKKCKRQQRERERENGHAH
jgi:hypothetical protein